MKTEFYREQKKEKVIKFLRDSCPENSDIIDQMVLTTEVAIREDYKKIVDLINRKTQLNYRRLNR